MALHALPVRLKVVFMSPLDGSEERRLVSGSGLPGFPQPDGEGKTLASDTELKTHSSDSHRDKS